MKRFPKRLFVVLASVMILILLSGCVIKTESVTVSFQNDKLSSSEHLFVRYSDGNVVQVPDLPNGTSIVATTDNTKTIVGGYISDGIISWVPNYSYSWGSVSIYDFSSVKPTSAVDHVVQTAQPIMDNEHPGYAKLTFAVYSADNQLVTGRTEIFAYSTDPSVTFYNTDPLDNTQPGFYTRTDTANGGFSSYTVNGYVTFLVKSELSDISTLPISLYSGAKFIWSNNLVDSIKGASVTITPPVLGMNPQNAAAIEATTANVGYTVSNVTWNEGLTANGKFKADQAYTATVELTSKNSKEFQAGAFKPTVANSVSVGNTTTSAPGVGNTVTFQVTYPATGALEVNSIAVTAQPTKMSYNEGTDDRLALNGLIVTETNNDGSITTSTFTSGTVSGYSTIPANGSTLTKEGNDGSPVTITHNASELTATTSNLKVTVNESTAATLTSTIGTVTNGTITNIPYGTTLAQLKAAITQAANATYEIYNADGETVATTLATGNKVIVTAQDGVTKATYTVTVNAAQPPVSGGGGGGSITPNDDKVISKDGKLTLAVGKKGEVSLEDELTISIPAGASDKELKLTIEKVLDTQKLITSKEVLASPVFEVLKNFSENFSNPVTLTFKFDPTSLKGDQKASVFYYDEVKKVWVEIGGKVNGNHITVESNHFTKFAVMAVGQEPNAPTDPKPTTSFSDIAGHWAEASIKQAASSGIVTGYTDGTFKPNTTVTRAEFAVMLMNALKLQGEGAALTFTDSAKIGAWAQKAIAQAVQAGIIKGYSDGTFRPDALITRAEMAAMIANATGKSIDANAATGFADDKDIPAWAKGSVAYVKQAGIVQGKGENKFAPQDQATRAEAVTVLLNLLAQKK